MRAHNGARRMDMRHTDMNSAHADLMRTARMGRALEPGAPGFTPGLGGMWRRRPMVLTALVLLAGDIIGLSGQIPLAAWEIMAAASALVAIVSALARRPRAWMLLICVMMLGGMMGASVMTAPELPAEGEHFISGRVLSVERDDAERMVLDIDNVETDGSRVKGRMRLTLYRPRPDMGEAADMPLPEGMAIGARVSLFGRTYIAQGARGEGGFDYRVYLMRRGVYVCGSGELAGARFESTGQLGLLDWVYRIRRGISSALDAELGAHAATARAIMLGDGDAMPEDMYESFRMAGFSHILAVSGMHVSFMALMIGWLLRPVPGWLRALITALMLAMYCALAGFTPSVMRAAIMGMAALCVRRAGLMYDAPSSLATAAVLIIMLMPGAALDTGFALSFGSVLSIYALYPGLRARLPRLGKGRGDRLDGRRRLLGKLMPRMDKAAPKQDSAHGDAGKTVPCMDKHDNANGSAGNTMPCDDKQDSTNGTAVNTMPRMAKKAREPHGAHMLSGKLLPRIMNGLRKLACALGNFAMNGIALSACVTIGLMPLTSAYFGQINLMGILTSSVGIAAGMGVLCMGWLTVLMHGWAGGLAKLTAGAAAMCARAIEGVAEWTAGMDWAIVSMRAMDMWWLLAIVPLIMYASRYRPLARRWRMACACAALCLMAVLLLPPQPFEGLDYVMVDVGQGDGMLFTDGASAIIVDTGSQGAALSDHVRRRGLRVDKLILTHLHEDHAGDALRLVRMAGIDEVYLPYAAESAADAEVLEALDIIKASGVNVRRLKAGDAIDTGIAGLELRVLHPGAQPEFKDANDYSLVLRAEYAGRSLLLTGDLTQSGEDFDVIECDVLKVAHHGSAGSSSLEFLAKANSKLALISASAHNRYGLPSRMTLERLEHIGARVLCTAQTGDITIHITPKGEMSARTYLGATEETWITPNSLTS